METYHKINGLYKRHREGPKKGKFIMGDWATPEIGYLAKNEWEFTEKVDGTNIRVHYRPHVATPSGFQPLVEFGGRSDNADIPKPLLAALETLFPVETFVEAFPDADAFGVLLFGEGYGPKIQSGGLYREDTSFVLFDVKIGDWWLHRKDVDDIADKLGIDSVPTLGHGTLQDAIDIVSTGITFNPLTHWGGNTLHGLRSTWGDFEAEGIVARPLVPLFDRKGQRIITKIKAVDFR